MRVQPRDQAEEAARLQRQMQQKQRQMMESRPGADGTPERKRAAAPVREGPKVGRNDPCPCGSGKKYKKCHGAEAA